MSELLKNLRADSGLDISNPSQVQQGYNSDVYSGETQEGKVFIRFNKGQNNFDIENWGYQKLDQIGVPVPKVLYFDMHPEHLQTPTLIISQVPGKPLSEIEKEVPSEQYHRVLQEAAKTLRQMHTIKMEGFGDAHMVEGRPVGENKSWGEYWRDRNIPARIQYLVDHRLIDDPQRMQLEEVYQEASQMDDVEGVFLHNDYHHAHIFSDGEKITGVIDLGNTLVGDPRFDIGVTFFYLTPEQREVFIKGYGALAEDPWCIKYALMVVVKRLGIRHQAGNEQGVIAGKKRLEELLR